MTSGGEQKRWRTLAISCSASKRENNSSGFWADFIRFVSCLAASMEAKLAAAAEAAVEPRDREEGPWAAQMEAVWHSDRRTRLKLNIVCDTLGDMDNVPKPKTHLFNMFFKN